MTTRGTPGREMKRFWDARAKENALFFVDNRLHYQAPDQARFWAEGERDLDDLLGSLGVHVDATMKVADIGCGVGRLTRPLSARAAEVLAIDVSDEMLAQARELNPALANVRWLSGDGTSLAPIRDSRVDACVSHVVFQHIPDPDITLGYVREMGRVLRPGGWAAFQVSNDPEVHHARLGSSLRGRLRVLARRGPRGQADPRWRGSAVELESLRAAATDGGMTLEQVIHPGTQFCMVLARRRL